MKEAFLAIIAFLLLTAFLHLVAIKREIQLSHQVGICVGAWNAGLRPNSCEQFMKEDQ